MSDPAVRVALSTAPDRDVGLRIARSLVAEGLAACVNVAPGVLSVYRWQGELCSDEEVLLIAKTQRDRVAALIARLEELHPYDVPELVVLAVDGGAEAYLRWVLAESAP